MTFAIVSAFGRAPALVLLCGLAVSGLVEVVFHLARERRLFVGRGVRGSRFLGHCNGPPKCRIHRRRAGARAMSDSFPTAARLSRSSFVKAADKAGSVP